MGLTLFQSRVKACSDRSTPSYRRFGKSPLCLRNSMFVDPLRWEVSWEVCILCIWILAGFAVYLVYLDGSLAKFTYNNPCIRHAISCRIAPSRSEPQPCLIFVVVLPRSSARDVRVGLGLSDPGVRTAVAWMRMRMAPWHVWLVVSSKKYPLLEK